MEYEIHPAIGIARVGSSRTGGENSYFVGPEPDNSPPSSYRDPVGDLKRQAARFRLFECRRDGRGTLVEASELPWSAVRGLTWTVHLANRKGVARRQYRTRPGFRNNATGSDDQDRALLIDSGPRSVMAPGRRQIFDGGAFRSTPVTLGEIAMDQNGRLLVWGGHGRAGSDPLQPRLDIETGHFADNDNWFDDISDGPVTATFRLANGNVAQATAWVIVGPPDFAPGIKNLVTLYDVLFDLAVKRGLLPPPTDLPEKVSFTRHIQPILNRALGYQWVNRAAAFGYDKRGTGHAPGGTGDFATRWAMLAEPSPASQELRASLVARLRNPDPHGPRPMTADLLLIPRLSDHQWYRSGAGNVLPLTATQYKIMQAWGAGDFVGDLGSPDETSELLPDALDRVALEACVGAALYPGVEVSGYIMNFPERFVHGKPFLISHDAVRPGEVTQYNAVPWHADFLYCSWEETQGLFPKRLGWWPAQRPDDVFTRVGGSEMVPWARGLGPDYQEMIDKWDRLGLVVDHGREGDSFFVEHERDMSALES